MAGSTTSRAAVWRRMTLRCGGSWPSAPRRSPARRPAGHTVKRNRPALAEGEPVLQDLALGVFVAEGSISAEIHTHHIETNIQIICVVAAAEVGARHAAEHALLLVIDGGFGGLPVAAGAGLDLDEAGRGAFPADEVDVAAQLCATPLAGDDGVAVAAEMEERGLFTAGAGGEMRRGDGR